MYLTEIFDDLAYGEFSNMAIGNSRTSGSITPDKYPRVVSLLNAGLLDLYSRFVLRRKELKLYQRADLLEYHLHLDHLGDPEAGDSNIYLEGDVNGDIIKILTAFDSLGNEIQLNKTAFPDDIFQPQFDIIKMKPRDPLEVVSLVYQAAHPRIVIGDTFDPTVYELTFPRFIKSALYANVAYRVFAGKAGQVSEGQQNPVNTHWMRYLSECKKLEEKSLIPQEEAERSQFEANGWV